MARKRRTAEEPPALGRGPYVLHLDYRMQFVPPMEEDDPGICLTRQLRLPFAPTEKTLIYSKSLDGIDDPEGMLLKDVIWDVDREVFLAEISISHHHSPLAEIPEILRSYIDLGWRFGSYRDDYTIVEVEEETEEEPENRTSAELWKDIGGHWDKVDEERMATWKGRSAEANAVFRALIRCMAETRSNESFAYAMQKTGRMYSADELEPEKVPAWETAKEVPAERKKFVAQIEAYSNLSINAQEKWRENTRRYASLEQLATGTRPRRHRR